MFLQPNIQNYHNEIYHLFKTLRKMHEWKRLFMCLNTSWKYFNINSLNFFFLSFSDASVRFNVDSSNISVEESNILPRVSCINVCNIAGSYDCLSPKVYETDSRFEKNVLFNGITEATMCDSGTYICKTKFMDIRRGQWMEIRSIELNVKVACK